MMNGADIEQGLRMEEAFNKLGLSMYTDEWAAKVLAFVNALKGTDEAVATNPALFFAMQCSFNKLYPNERLNPAMVDLLNTYSRELADKGLQTPWLKDIARRYALDDLRGMWENAGYKV
jgi:hypothetical protein